MFLKGVLIGLWSFIFYLGIEWIQTKKIMEKMHHYLEQKNEKYYENLLKYYEKNKKIKMKKQFHFLRQISILAERCGVKKGIMFYPAGVVVLGIFCVNIVYHLSFYCFHLVVVSLFISLPCFFFPMAILYEMAEWREAKIEKIFLQFLLQLKNHTQIHNDVVLGMKGVRVSEPLHSEIRRFLIELSSGVPFDKAIDNWKEKVKSHQIQAFLENMKRCFLYGGNFPELMEKSYQMMNEIQQEKAKRKEETRSARMVLFLLMILNIFVYITFIQSNQEHQKILCDSLVGNLILYWNFGSMWLLVLLANRVKKVDE